MGFVKGGSMINIEEQVRRMELNFRIEFPFLTNEIYCLEKYHYVVYCLFYEGDHNHLKATFERKYGSAAYRVELVFDKPVDYLYEVRVIDFDNIVEDFNGMVLTEQSLNVFVRGLLWNLDIISIVVSGSGIGTSIKVIVSSATSDAAIKKANRLLSAKKIGCDNVSAVKATTEEVDDTYDNITEGLLISNKFPFTLKENALWYELAPRIYAGEIKRNNIDFFRTAETACYINCYMGLEQIDIRALMVIFHVVYMTPPSKQNFDNFLKSQKLEPKDLIELIVMGKVVLVLTHNENNFSKEFIDSVYKEFPLGIIGQRGINLLLVTYLNELRIKYESIFPNIREEATELLYRADACKSNILRSFAKYMSWPIYGTLNSFAYLCLSEPHYISGFDVLSEIQADYSEGHFFKKPAAFGDLSLFSADSYIAAALSAIFIPTSDDRIRDLHFKIDNLTASILKNYSYKPSTNEKLNKYQLENSDLHLDIFDFKSNINPKYVARAALDYESHHVFARLINSLGNMSLEERNLKCREYNDLLFNIMQLSSKQQNVIKKLLLGVPGLVPLPEAISNGLSVLGFIRNLYKSTTAYQDNQEIKKIEKVLSDLNIEINEDLVDEVYVLDKMSSIVRLR